MARLRTCFLPGSMNLKTAVGWSVVFHVSLLVMQPPQGFAPVEQERTIRVTYVSMPQAAPSLARANLQPTPASIHTEKPPAPSVSTPPTPKPPRQETPPRPIPQPVVPPPAPAVQGQPVTVRDADARSSAISNLPEGEFAALQHKQQVRQHLKQRLAFPPGGIQGTVRLRLILAPSGALQDLVLLDASDSRLSEVALAGARSAGPYPPFPSQLKKSQVLYEYIIQYRLE